MRTFEATFGSEGETTTATLPDLVFLSILAEFRIQFDK